MLSVFFACVLSVFGYFVVIDEQFVLQRLANAAIDIYGMAAVISRLKKTVRYFLCRERFVSLKKYVNREKKKEESSVCIGQNIEKKDALAGSRTRIYCLEGNNANRYTTNASCLR